MAGISKQSSRHYKTLLIMSLKEVRNQLLISHDDGVINDEELPLLHDLNRSDNVNRVRTILILVLTSIIWKTTSAFQSFASTRETYHFWLKS